MASRWQDTIDGYANDVEQIVDEAIKSGTRREFTVSFLASRLGSGREFVHAALYKLVLDGKLRVARDGSGKRQLRAVFMRVETNSPERGSAQTEGDQTKSPN